MTCSLRSWTRALPLTTVSHIIRLIDHFELRPKDKDWAFRLIQPDIHEFALFRHIIWGPPPREIPYDPEIQSKHVVIAVQAPWILADQDVIDFANVRTVSDFYH